MIVVYFYILCGFYGVYMAFYMFMHPEYFEDDGGIFEELQS